ncbi:MAG: MFS transporter [Chloroflexi bacterium]|nr:MAG: hypothetical protein CUN54_03090 [Phototrophicales bacterium]RMF80079.1 MAG: MFS transporter [Chloroflexota bacterium]
MEKRTLGKRHPASTGIIYGVDNYSLLNSQHTYQAQGMTEERLDFGRVLPIFVLVLVDVLGLTIVLPLLHLYAAAFNANAFQIGLVAAAFPLAQLIGVPFMGALSDRYGRKPLLLISQITTYLSFVMLGLAGSLEIVILSRVIDGLFGANIATAQAALSDITSEKTRTQALGLTGAAFGIGFILGPLIAFAALEFRDSLAIPAFIAASYSLLSIILTLVFFKETLPREQRKPSLERLNSGPLLIAQMIRRPNVNLLLILMFAQQFIFFGFESLLGLFTLSRLGMLGQGNAIVFIVVGVILVTVQGRMIGSWSRKYGDEKLIQAALVLLATGLLLIAIIPEQPHPLYVRQIVERELRTQTTSSTEAIIGDISITLPNDENNGFVGIGLLLIAVVPLSIGAGLVRPSLNSLMTKQVEAHEYGSVLSVSTAFVSMANATAPLVGGLIFQQHGASSPFLLGGVAMTILSISSIIIVRFTNFSTI